MKRNMDVIRAILLRFETVDRPRVSRRDLTLDGYTTEQVDLHLDLMKEAGLIDHQIVRPNSGSGYSSVGIDMGLRPTMLGYDFLDSIRDPEIWRRTKEGADKAGGATIEFVWELAKSYGKQVIKERLGIDLA